MLTVLTTLGLAVITGAIKCATEETLAQAALSGLDTIFGGILGNVCHERFNQIKENFDPNTTPKQNADVERCSRDALLQALIAFSNAAKSQIEQTTLTDQQKKDCLYFLGKAQNSFTEQLPRLTKLLDTEPVFQRNLLTQPDTMVQILATGQEQERITRIKVELTEFALTEFGYQPENILQQQLAVWLPQGLPKGQHWFVYYIHAFYGNLKEDKPPYCQKARRILTHNQLANLDLLAKRSLARIEELMIFTREIREVLVEIKEQLNRIETQGTRVEGGLDKVITILEAGHQRTIPHQLTAIPALSGEFVGREDDTKRLGQLLQSSRKVVLMNGIGGVGKTTLAKWFVRDQLTQYRHICWIDVTKQDATVNGKLISGSLKEAMAEHTVLFKNLDVAYNPKGDSVDQRFETITNALRNLEGHNLFVIDNAGADAGERGVRNQLPQPPQWHVLITSRQNLTGYELMPLDSLSPDAAETLFYTYYTYDCLAVEIKALLEAIGYHTLTVELFAKTLEAHHGMLSVGELLRKVHQKELSDPALKRQLETEHHPDETEVYLHLMLAFDCAELTTTERTLLGQFSLLPPEPYTLKDHLAPWLGYTNPEQLGALTQTVNQLVKKGWLNQTKHTYSLHRLIQQVATYQISFDWEAARPLVESIRVLLNTVDNPNALAVYPLRKYGEYLLAAIPALYQDKSETADLKNNLALVYKDLGRYEEAAHLLEQALSSEQTHFGDNHPSVATSRSNLAMVYRDLGRYEEAARLLEQALSSGLTHFGDDHPSVAIRRSNLALVYQDLGRYEEAARLMEQALSSEQTHFGDDHPTVAISRSSLALVYRDLGRYEEAARLLEQALSSEQTHFGDDHPTVAIGRSNLALVYQDLGRYEEAARLLEQALSRNQTHFGDDHPKVAISRSNLALVYRDLGRCEEAARLLEQILSSEQTHFGDDHPTVARSQLILATVILELNRPDEAFVLLRQAESTFVQRLGAQHPHTINVRSWLKKVADLLDQ